MLKTLRILFLFFLSCSYCFSQDTVLDSALEVDLRFNSKAMYIPIFSILVTDNDDVTDTKELENDLKNGDGYGLYVGLDIFDSFDIETLQIGFGVIYQSTEHDTTSRTYNLEAEALLFEVNSYLVFFETEKFKIFQQIGLSAGYVEFDFDAVREDFSTGMISNRYLLNFDIFNHIMFNIGGGIYAWGHPGKTHAYGGYLTIEFGLRF